MYTAYENTNYAKPNPDYYRDLMNRLGLKANECIMVGNDVDEDMIAKEVGMNVFLLSDCIVNRKGKDISVYPNGNCEELEKYISLLL